MVYSKEGVIAVLAAEPANLDKKPAFHYTFHHEIALQNDLQGRVPQSPEKRFPITKDFLLWDLNNSSSILLFNIGNRLFAYSPCYGVWKTDGLASHLEDLDVLRSKLKYPGIENVERVEFIPN